MEKPTIFFAADMEIQPSVVALGKPTRVPFSAFLFFVLLVFLVDKGVEISFRVRQNYGPSQITITCGEKQLARFKRQRMAPGEMEHITLPGVLLAKADGPLTVAVEEVVAK